MSSRGGQAPRSGFGVGRAAGLAAALALVLQGGGAPVAAQNTIGGPGGQSAVASLKACSEVWTANTQDELAGYAAEVDQNLDDQIAHYQQQTDQQIAAIQNVTRDISRLERLADQALADGDAQAPGTGLAPPTAAEVKQARAALGGNAAANAALAELQTATQKFAGLRDAFSLSVKAIKGRQAVKTSFAACVADQRQYLAANGQPASAAPPAQPADADVIQGTFIFSSADGAYGGRFAVQRQQDGSWQGPITWTQTPLNGDIHVGDHGEWYFHTQPSGDVNDPNTMFGQMTGHIDPATHVGAGTFVFQCQNPALNNICRGEWSTSSR